MSNRMPWFRMWNEARNDPKLELLTDAQHRVWHRLLCFASEQDDRGTIEYRSFKVLAVQVARGDEALLAETLDMLSELEIIDYADSLISFINWDRRQYDKESDRPDATRDRKRKQREKAKQPEPPPNGHAMSRGVTPMPTNVTPVHAVEEKREEERREEEKTERAHKHVTPDTSPLSPKTLAQQVQDAAGVYSSAIDTYIPQVAAAAAVADIDLVVEAQLYREKYAQKGRDVTAAGLRKWIDNELHPDRRRNPPARAGPSSKQNFKLFGETA